MTASGDDPETLTSADVPEPVRRALAALLAIDAGSAEAVRRSTPSRRRPRRQRGPVADFGDAEFGT